MSLILSALALFAAGATAISDEEIGHWLAYYYLNPEPVEAINYLTPLNAAYLRNKGISLAGESERGGIRSFYAEILAASPEAVRELERTLPELDLDVRVFANAAIARCASDECKRIRGFPLSEVEEPLSVAALDDYWAAFFATGDRKHVEKVVSALPLIEVRGDVDRLMIGGSAKWSLSSNAYQHSRVLEICKAAALVAEEPVKSLLMEIVAEAEKEREKNPPPEPQESET